MALPREVILTDHNLEQVADRSAAQLARHRWHWTLDESNPGRVSIAEYSRQVARNESTVRATVNGYAMWLDENTSGGYPPRSLGDYQSRARMGTETRAATEAVARARGIATETARRGHADESRRVRDIARQRAEERGTSIEEEAPKIAETIVRHEQALRAEAADKAQRSELRVIQAEQQVLIAKRAVLRAIKELENVDLDDEERDLLVDAHNALKAVSALFDARLSGKSGVDWDAEFAKVADSENL